MESQFVTTYILARDHIAKLLVTCTKFHCDFHSTEQHSIATSSPIPHCPIFDPTDLELFSPSVHSSTENSKQPQNKRSGMRPSYTFRLQHCQNNFQTLIK